MIFNHNIIGLFLCQRNPYILLTGVSKEGLLQRAMCHQSATKKTPKLHQKKPHFSE